MAQRSFYNLANDWIAVVDAGINDSVESVVLQSSGASGCPSVPFLCSIGSEILCCTAVDVDTPSAGKDTLTISRGFNGTTPTAHSAGDRIRNNIYSYNFEELQRILYQIMLFLSHSRGGFDGVIRYGTDGGLKVTEQDTPDMTVLVSSGAGLLSNQVIGLLEDTTTEELTAADAGYTKIAIVQISNDNVVSVKYGTPVATPGSPSAPTVDTDNYVLAEVLLTESTSTVTDSDITDKRTFI